VRRRRRFALTIRDGPRVQRHRFESLQPALDVLETEMRSLAQTGHRSTVDLRYRRFEPVQQVMARAELRGPDGLRAGLDLRGDGSAEAYTGRLTRDLVAERDGEDAFQALRRTLTEGAS